MPDESSSPVDLQRRLLVEVLHLYEAEKNSESVLAARAPRQTHWGEVTMLPRSHRPIHIYSRCLTFYSRRIISCNH